MLKKNWFMPLAVRISSYGCTWEVWRALKKLELTRYTHAKHEPILGIARYIRNSINYENIQPLDENLELQWNLSNTDTEGTEKGVRIRGVSIV